MESQRAFGHLGEEAQTRAILHQTISAMIIGEGQLIWMRYSAMLAVNAILGLMIAALAAKENVGSREGVFIACTSVFGLFLCRQWKVLTSCGWQIQVAWVKEAEKYRLPGQKNACGVYLGVAEAYSQWQAGAPREVWHKDEIKRRAERVIIIFVLAYLFCIGWAAIVIAGVELRTVSMFLLEVWNKIVKGLLTC